MGPLKETLQLGARARARSLQARPDQPWPTLSLFLCGSLLWSLSSLPAPPAGSYSVTSAIARTDDPMRPHHSERTLEEIPLPSCRRGIPQRALCIAVEVWGNKGCKAM